MAPYAVDSNYFLQHSAAAQADRALARWQLGIPTDDVVFVASGKLIPSKRPLDLLHPFAESEARTNTTLLYVGDGILRNKVEDTAHYLGVGQHVVVLGFRNQSGLPAIYGAGDVLVLPSEHEPWGLLANEGMAGSLAPVVSNHVGADSDLVPRDWIYPSGNVGRLALLLGRLARSPTVLAEAKRQASLKIATWVIDECVDSILKRVEASLDSTA